MVWTPLMQDRGETILPRYLLTKISLSIVFIRLLRHYLFVISPCPCHVSFPSVLFYCLHLRVNCSEFRRRMPLQCENAMIHCNLPQRMRINLGAPSKTELRTPFEQTHPTLVLHVSLIKPWLNANLFKNIHHISIMQYWPECKITSHFQTPFFSFLMTFLKIQITVRLLLLGKFPCI